MFLFDRPLMPVLVALAVAALLACCQDQGVLSDSGMERTVLEARR